MIGDSVESDPGTLLGVNDASVENGDDINATVGVSVIGDSV